MSFINGGKLIRNHKTVSRPSPHTCPKPGFFSRLLNGIKEGDAWICSCGHKYTLEFIGGPVQQLKWRSIPIKIVATSAPDYAKILRDKKYPVV